MSGQSLFCQTQHSCKAVRLLKIFPAALGFTLSFSSPKSLFYRPEHVIKSDAQDTLSF